MMIDKEHDLKQDQKIMDILGTLTMEQLIDVALFMQGLTENQADKSLLDGSGAVDIVRD